MTESAENLLRDALQKRGIATHLGLADDFVAALAAAFRAGQIAQAEDDAKIANAHADRRIGGMFWDGISTASEKIAAQIRANADRLRAEGEGESR